MRSAQIRDDMVTKGIQPNAVTLMNPDFQALAKAYGCNAEKPRILKALAEAIKAALKADGPTLIEMTPRMVHGMDSAVIFDVDGVLLDLTRAGGRRLLPAPSNGRYGLTGLSRDWDSYRIRNDEHIIAEILERHGLPADDAGRRSSTDYLSILSERPGDRSR